MHTQSMAPTASDDGANLPGVSQTQPTASWLATNAEEALEPSLPIVDCHHHFSEHWGGYFVEDLLRDAEGGHLIEKTVYVQCGWRSRQSGPEVMRPIGETEAVVEAAKRVATLRQRTQVAAGIVGFVDLRFGEEAADVLAAQVEAGRGRLRGIRQSGARHAEFKYGVLPRPPAGLFSDPKFRAGYATLKRFGLSFDAWVYHSQLGEVIALARANPETPLILNHYGGLLGVGPYASHYEAGVREWRSSLRELAELPNVMVKLGGAGGAVFGFDFCARTTAPSSRELADAFRPLYDPVLELFGAQRCMFESNFPVDRTLGNYTVLWNAYKRLAAGATDSEKEMLFHGTATRAYRLNSN